MEKEFKAAYNQLNAAQKEAVDTIDGPVLVVAGPGTGKTQLLSLRVANILRLTDTDPSSVLCLTFTNFAATNMRDRLTKLVGLGAHNVMVRTFHSFAAEIMNQYQDYFWNGARLSVAPDAVQLEVIEDILNKLPLKNPLAMKFSGTLTALSDVQQALKLTKEAGLTPEKLKAMIDVNEAYIDVIEPDMIELLEPALNIKKLDSLLKDINSLPDQLIDASISPLTSLSTVIEEGLALAIKLDKQSGKTTETGKWKRRWIQSVSGRKAMYNERKRNEWWSAIVPVYKLYRNTLHERNYYDYSDMLVEVISQLETHPELLASVQEQYLYVMIDEFQDSNSAQLRIAHLIATNQINDSRPNLLAVGDDDQTIFAFNGAELKNMLSFERTYDDAKLIVLQNNYRSTQNILDAAKGIIENADNRLVKQHPDLSKDLVAAGNIKKGKIRHQSYPTRQHELYQIAKQVEQSWREGDSQNIAVLSRSHKSLREISSLLNEAGVPISYEQSNNALDHPLIKQMYYVAETIVAITEGDIRRVNSSVSTFLQHPAWAIKPLDLWGIALSNQGKADWLNYLAKNKDINLSAIGNWLLWLASESTTEPMSVILDNIIGLRDTARYSSPLKKYFVDLTHLDSTYLDGLSALDTLMSVTNEFTVAKSSFTNIKDFVRFVDLHQKLDRPITDESWFTTGDNAIQLMTVHKAKGLEFDTVIILDVNEDNWRPRHIGRKPPANLPLQPYGEQYDDYVRLLYVGATRAKRSLILGSYNSDGQGKALLPTPLISHLEPELFTQKGKNDLVEVLESTLRWPRLKSTDEKALLSNKLKDYHLNATAFLQFLDVTNGGPGQFLQRQMLRLPQATTNQMAYGTAIHKSLQHAQNLVNTKRFSIKEVIAAYNEALSEQQLTTIDFKRYLEHGTLILESLFNELDFQIQQGDQAEVSLQEVIVGEAKLSGMLDSVCIDKNTLTITDYKTGKPLHSFETHDQLKAIKAWRHRNQLLFYSLLANASSRFTPDKQIKTRMLYVEATDRSELILEHIPSAGELKQLQKLINIVWEHIMNLNFPDTNSYDQSIAGIRDFEQDLLDGKI